MVSNLGRVATYTKSLEGDGELVKPIGGNGMAKVTIRVKDESVRYMLHRMIAETFVKPLNKTQKALFILTIIKKIIKPII
jgi:protein-L-isoaspartate O-methyltransferase